jgi:hypothetical protein
MLSAFGFPHSALNVARLFLLELFEGLTGIGQNKTIYFENAIERGN